ncbi:uncharacterized protein CLUP02_17290 [Colletotrichum lupini]|uniref:Uncharacterized protein n=1 Tax=Colletotrichum lupini TaxID=145971 RepID=A0A9Q8SFY1_9PEZI|nr:uncharacterized protein CLUP02_17290 [Colletotrichum lupini]UQC75782.1 hypothetical protein CLUP02_17290 [Colletotrichum lupini]
MVSVGRIGDMLHAVNCISILLITIVGIFTSLLTALLTTVASISGLHIAYTRRELIRHRSSESFRNPSLPARSPFGSTGPAVKFLVGPAMNILPEAGQKLYPEPLEPGAAYWSHCMARTPPHQESGTTQGRKSWTMSTVPIPTLIIAMQAEWRGREFPRHCQFPHCAGGMAEKKERDKADSRPTFSSAPSRRSGSKAESRTGSSCTSIEDILPATDSDPRIHTYSKIRHRKRLSDARAKRGSPSLQMAFDFSGAVRNIRPKTKPAYAPLKSRTRHTASASLPIPTTLFATRDSPRGASQATHVERFERFLNPEFWGLRNPRASGPLVSAGAGYGTLFGQRRRVTVG